MTAEEVRQRANQIAKDWYEEQAWLAERRVEAEAEAKRKMERKRIYLNTGDEDKERLLEIPCDAWLPALTQIEVPAGRKVSCPLPGHDDKTPSCVFYSMWFNCFGCHRGGDVFVFAGALWEMDHRTRFPELLRLLAARLL